MGVEIPYRAAGTFTGEAYVERKADRALLREIHGNRRFPYIVAPRQSGKSSLLVRTHSHCSSRPIKVGPCRARVASGGTRIGWRLKSSSFFVNASAVQQLLA